MLGRLGKGAVAAVGATAGLGMGAVATGAPTTPQPTIVYVAQSCSSPNGPCPTSVNVVGEDGSGPVPLATYSLTPFDQITAPTWSPRGAFVAWAVPVTNASATTWDEVVARPDGTDTRTIGTYQMPQAPSLTWSPDGTRLATATNNGIVVSAPDGSGRYVVAANSSDIAWSPDDSQIAYAVPAPSGGGIVGISPNASRQHLLVSDSTVRAAGGCGQGDAGITWSPDGRSLAFVEQECPGQTDQPNPWDLFVADLASGSVRKIGAGYQEPPVAGWSPDGSELAVGGLAVIRPDGTVVWTRNGGGLFPSPSWAPDGQRLSYIGSDQTVHVIDSDGSGDTSLATTAGAFVSAAFSPSPIAARYLGVLRTDTAVDVARNTWISAPAVVIARDDAYPDALAAAPVAAKAGGPLLLTDPDGLPGPVCQEIQALGAHSAYIMGDTTAVSSYVDYQLGSCGVSSTTRLQGPTRFDTAAAAATFVGGSTVYIAEGADPDPTKGWPDAVSVSALAADQRRPILLVSRDSLPDATRSALQRLGVSQATIVGGTASVSDQVANQISSMGITVTRVAGADRYATSAAVASLGARSGLSADRVWLAIGNNWPDALSAGPAAAQDGADLLLVDGSSLADSPPSQSWLSSQGGAITSIRVVGGPDVLSPADEMEALRIAGG